MPPRFSPRLDVLPGPQIRLWPDLVQVPTYFALYGGTALALHLGHRTSVDFDFFGSKNIDPDTLLTSVPFLSGAQVVRKSPNTLDVNVQRDGAVKMSFFGVPSLKRLRPPRACPDNQLRIASLLDLAGTKVAVVQNRSESKDYLDIAAIIEDGRVTLPMALSAAQAIYGRQFNPQISLKALSFFGDGDLKSLSQPVRKAIANAVQRVDLQRLPPVLTASPARKSPEMEM